MSAVFSVGALEIKRPAGVLTRVDRLVSASLQVEADVRQGGAVTVSSVPWRTAKAGPLSWSLSVQAADQANNAGLQAALEAARGGERLEVEAVLGDGRRISGYAYCRAVGRGGGSGGAFSAGLEFTGSGKLWGFYEAAYPAAPAGLAVVRVAAGSVTLSWDEVADVDGYYLYWVPSRSGGGYPFWEKIATSDLADSANPEYTVYNLRRGVPYFFVVTSYETDAPGVLESEYSSEVTATPLGPTHFIALHAATSPYQLASVEISTALAGSVTVNDLGAVDAGYGADTVLMPDEGAQRVYACISAAGGVVKGYSWVTGAETSSITLATKPVEKNVVARRPSDGRFFVGTTGGGIYRMASNGGSSALHASLGATALALAFYQPTNSVYAVTSAGLFAIDADSGAVETVCGTISTAESLSYGQLTLALEDNRAFLYYDGDLFVFNTATGVVTSVAVSNTTALVEALPDVDALVTVGAGAGTMYRMNYDGTSQAALGTPNLEGLRRVVL
jgi:hypothetical protein